MSSARRVQQTPAVAKDARRRVKQAVRSACDSPPATPQNAYITYDQLGRHRHHRFRGIWGCDEVTEDTDGYPIKPEGYTWRVREVDASGVDQWNGHYPHDSIRNRPDDPFVANEQVGRHGFHHGHYYESSWQAYNQNGVSEWSDWSPKVQFLETVNPLAPTVTLFDVDQHKMRVEWTNPDDPGNVLIHHRDTLSNVIQIATGSGFSTIVKTVHAHAGSEGHRVIKFPKPGSATWWVRVGAKTQGGLIEWSAGVSGSRVLPPTPTVLTSSDVTFKDGGREYVRAFVAFSYGGSYDDDDIKAALLEYQYETGNPVNGDDVHGPVIKHFQPGDSISGHWIIKKLRPGRKLRLRWAVKDTKGHQSAWTAWSSVITVTDPASLPSLSGLAIDVDQHKIEISCTDPDDPNFSGQRHEAVRFFHFQVWRGAVSSGTLVYENARLKHPQKLLKGRKPGTDTFNFRARPIGYDGGLGSWAGPVSGNRIDPPAPSAVVTGDLTWSRGGKHQRSLKIAYSYAGAYTDDDVTVFGIEWQVENHTLGSGDNWHGPRTHHHPPGEAVSGHFMLHKLRAGDKIRFRTFVKDSKHHRSAYSSTSASFTVPGKKPGPARNVKLKKHRDSFESMADPPNQWDDTTTEDWTNEQVDRYLHEILTTSGSVATYSDGTSLSAESKSPHHFFPALNDDGSKLTGRPFKNRVTPIGHDEGNGDVTGTATTAATGVNPIDTTTGTVGTDGVAPSSSPTPTLIGGPTFIYFKWDPITNADPVTYEVHMSTSSGFTPGAGTKLADVTGTGFVAKKTAGGSDLAYGTTYYGKIIAKDADGSAAASSQASAAMVQIGTTDITPDSITSALIVAGTIVASDIAAGTITADRLNITTLSAITADLGTVTAGSITGVTIQGGTIRTAASGSTRWEMTSGTADSLLGYRSSTLAGMVIVSNASPPSWISASPQNFLGLYASLASGPYVRVFDGGLVLSGYGTGASGLGIGIGSASDSIGFFASNPVTQRADPGNVTGTADLTYSANDRDLINDCKTAINDIFGILRAYGLI